MVRITFDTLNNKMYEVY